MDKTNSLKEQIKLFYDMLKVTKVPWYLYILTLIMDMMSSTLFVQVAVLLGQIMEGEIFDKGKITSYAVQAIAQELFLVAGSILFYWVSLKMKRKMAISIWGKSLNLKVSDLDEENPSSLISRVTNDPLYINVAISGMFQIIHVIYSMTIIMIQMMKMNITLATALIGVFVWILLTILAIGRISFKGQKEIQETYSVFTSYLAERIPLMRLVKSFHKEQHENVVGESKIEQQYGADIYMVKVNALTSLLQTIGKVLVNLIVLIYGGYLVGKGEIQVGDLITFFVFATQSEFIYNAVNISMYYKNFRMGLGGLSKISKIVTEEGEKKERRKSFSVPDADIIFENVSFQYQGKEVLKNLNFKIPKGKVTAIVGPSGSGKTTMLKLLERFYSPHSGKITYGDTDLEEFHLDEWRKSIGYVFQNDQLITGTIRDNIMYGVEHEVKEETIIKAAKLAKAYDFIIEFEKGFETTVGESGSRLSSGQKQRIAIARALIRNPEILLLDEVTCNLDSQNEFDVMESLNKYIKGKTAVVVAHNINTVRNADNILVLDRGRIVDSGNHESLYAGNSIYRTYCDINLA